MVEFNSNDLLSRFDVTYPDRSGAGFYRFQKGMSQFAQYQEGVLVHSSEIEESTDQFIISPSGESFRVRLVLYRGLASQPTFRRSIEPRLHPYIMRHTPATKMGLSVIGARFRNLEQPVQWNPTVLFKASTAYEEGEPEIHEAVLLNRGLRILNRGLKISALLFGVSISLLAVNIGLGLIGAYLAGACWLIHLYAHWLETGEVILNPRYVVVGIIAAVGLALTALVAMIT